MEQIDPIVEVHDCSNCRFRRDVAPYSVLLGCGLDGKPHSQPYTCNRWESLLYVREVLNGKS